MNNRQNWYGWARVLIPLVLGFWFLAQAENAAYVRAYLNSMPVARMPATRH